MIGKYFIIQLFIPSLFINIHTDFKKAHVKANLISRLVISSGESLKNIEYSFTSTCAFDKITEKDYQDPERRASYFFCYTVVICMEAKSVDEFLLTVLSYLSIL